MSTNPTPQPVAGAPASINKILAALENVGGYVTLAVTVGEELVPLVKVAVAGIKSLFTTQPAVDYSVLVGDDFALLQGIETESATDIAADNADLTAAGAPTVPVPAITPEPPAPADGTPVIPAPSGPPATPVEPPEPSPGSGSS